jgi:Recombination endonuclease VII
MICVACKQPKSSVEFQLVTWNGNGKSYPRKRCNECRRAQRRSLYARENLRLRKRELWYRYRITEERYDQLLKEQNGVCAICLQPPTPENPLVVDHDHSCCSSRFVTCGKCVRGLLHRTCNHALGIFMDNSDRLRQAADFLDKSQKKER